MHTNSFENATAETQNSQKDRENFAEKPENMCYDKMGRGGLDHKNKQLD